MRSAVFLFLCLMLLAPTSAKAENSLDYFEIKTKLKAFSQARKGLTTVQQKALEEEKKEYIRALTGQTVEWKGWIDDVRSSESWVSGAVSYTIKVDMDPPSKFFSDADLSIVTADSNSAQLSIDMPVTINGMIKDINSSGDIDIDLNTMKEGHDEKITQEELDTARKEKEQALAQKEAERKALTDKYNAIEEQGATAYVTCKTVIKQQLTAPKTAKFPWTDFRYNVHSDNKTATVSSYVDSQNGFGAMIRTNFECLMEYKGNGGWQIRDIKTY